MSENDAKNLIAKFVREVLAELDKGEPYDMYQFGSFTKENNEVVFKQWKFQSENQNEEQNQNEDENEEQSENESENQRENEDQREEQKQSESENENESELGEETQVVATIKRKHKTNWLSHAILVVAVLLLSAVTYIAINLNTLKKDIPLIAQLFGDKEKPSGLKTISTEPIDAINETVETEKVPEELTIINIPPTESVQKNALKIKKESKAAPKKVNTPPKQATKPTVKKAKQTVVQATNVRLEAVKPIKAKTSKPTNKQFPSFNNLPFQLIAGSFSSQQAAAKNATLLARKSITTCAISQFDGKFRVSLQGYATKDSALEGMNSFKLQVSDTWVFEVK